MNVGFIGCGNMGGALAFAVSQSLKTNIYISDFDSAKTDALKAKIPCAVLDSDALVRASDFVFLGVKPNGLAGLLESLKAPLLEHPNTVLVSMAAGVSIEKILSMLPTPHPVIRIMPNTPVNVGEGMTLYSVSDAVTPGTEAAFLSLMEKTGAVDAIDEVLIDAACAVAGCGPAFGYMFIDALAKAGESAGLTYEKAKFYAAKMLKGAAEMVLQSEKSPDTLRKEVCSPGGSTIEGVKVFDAEDLAGITHRAVTASFEKTKALGK